MFRTLMVYLFVSCIGIGFSLDACGKDLAKKKKKEKQKSEAQDCGCSQKDGTSDCFCAMFEYATYENGGNQVHCYFGWACYADSNYGGSACAESLTQVAPSMSASCTPGGDCLTPHCFTFDGGRKKKKPYDSGQIPPRQKKIAEIGLPEMIEWEYDPLHPPYNSGIAVGDPVYARISLKKSKIYAKLFPITHVPTGRSVSLGFECHRRPLEKPQDVGSPTEHFDSGTEKTRMIEVKDERTEVTYCVFLNSQTDDPHYRDEQKKRTKKKE